MTESSTSEKPFDPDPDWRFPLRLGFLPNREADAFAADFFRTLYEPLKPLITRVRLGVDGLDCDVVVVRSPSELRALIPSVTLSANLVLMLDEGATGGVDAEVAAAAAHSVGATGYAIADGTAHQKLDSFVFQLSHRRTIEESLAIYGSSRVVGDTVALAVPPLAAFLDRVGTFRRYGLGADSFRMTGFAVDVTPEMVGEAADQLGLHVGMEINTENIVPKLTGAGSDRYFTHESGAAAIAAGIGRDDGIAASFTVADMAIPAPAVFSRPRSTAASGTERRVSASNTGCCGTIRC